MSKSDVVRLPYVASLSGDDCRLLVESIVDYAIFMLDVDGRVATWNRGAERIKGYAASEIVGRHFSTFYPAEDVESGKPQHELEVAAQEGRFEDEGWRIRKDGSRFWANVIITALREANGSLRGFGKITRDLTARRAAEAEQRWSEQRFHHLVDSVIDYAIFMLDPEGRVASWNPGAHRLKGYSADEIMGRYFSLFYTAEDRASGKPERILETVRHAGRCEDESWRVRKDGTRFWANVVISALHDEHGKLLGFAKVTRDLTDRRNTEEELRTSEERFRLLVETIGDYAIYMLDAEGRVTTWNLGAQRMKGYSASEVLGQDFAIFFPESDRAQGKPAAELAAARSSGRFEDEGWRVRKDGTRFWANAVVTALQNTRGELIGFAKITRDLTARREAEAIERRLLQEQAARSASEDAERRVRASEERYRALSKRLEIVLEGVADGITVVDQADRIVFANSAAARLCGFASADELLESTAAAISERFEILDENDRPFDSDKLPRRRVLAGEPSSSAVLHMRERRSSREWWTHVKSTAVLGEDGRPELAVNIWHDVTAERDQERQAKYLADATAALAASLNYDEMLRNLAGVVVPGLADWCGIQLLDGEQLHPVTAAHVDPEKLGAVTEYFRDFPPDRELGGSNVVRTGKSALYGELSRQRLLQTLARPEQRALLERIGVRSLLLLPIRAGSRVLGLFTLAFGESNRHYGEAHVVLGEELGRRAGAALENARLYQAAQEAAQSAAEASRAKDEFLATVSHELRTPLSAILGWSTLLRGRLTDPSLAKPIEVIHRNAEAQVKIIDDILDVSRVITGKFRLDARPVDLVSIAREALEVVRPSATAKKIALELSTHAPESVLVADPERLQQVIWNLLSNAVKFTDSGGKIQLSVRAKDSNLVLQVRDDGKGIDPSFLPFVFDRFRQADSSTTRSFGGLGLGLALVRHIVELHGGRVAAHSEGPGKGATFTITLPIRAVSPATLDSPLPPRAHTPLPPQSTTLGGVRVLVVDDEPDARELIATVLRQAGAQVETAPSVAEGIETFKRFHPDVLVSDIGMPHEDGFALMRRIRALPAADGGRTPSLALTAFAREEDRTKAIAAGFTTHIGKPVNPDALASAVANLAAVTRSY